MNQGKKKKSICINGFILGHSNLKQFFFYKERGGKKWCFKMKQEYTEIKYFVYFVGEKNYLFQETLLIYIGNIF